MRYQAYTMRKQLEPPVFGALKEEFMEVDEYFEPYLTETNLIRANERLTEWLVFYNFKRPHQTLDYRSPFEYYHYKFFKKQKLSPIPDFNTLLTF